MHVQRAVEGFDVFARALSIGAETMVMWFDPDRPIHDRYQVAHDFLSPEAGRRGRDDLEDRQRVLPVGVQLVRVARRGDEVYPIDYANASPGCRADVAALLLPVGDDGARALVRVLRRAGPAHAHRRRLRGRGSRSPTATTSRTTRSSRSTAGSRTSTSRPRPTRSSAPAPWRTSTSRARVVHVSRTSTGARRDRADDVPGPRARAVRRALPRTAALVGGDASRSSVSR